MDLENIEEIYNDMENDTISFDKKELKFEINDYKDLIKVSTEFYKQLNELAGFQINQEKKIFKEFKGV